MNRRQLFKGLAMAPAVPLVALVDEPRCSDPRCDGERHRYSKHASGLCPENAKGWRDACDVVIKELHTADAERDWLAEAWARVQAYCDDPRFCYVNLRDVLDKHQGDGRWDPEKRRLR